MTRQLLYFAILLLTLFANGNRAFAADPCTFAISDINFGTVTLLDGAEVDTSGTLTITCPAALTLTTRVCVNIEAGSGGSVISLRTMRASGRTLSYQLYQDADRKIPWGSYMAPLLGTVRSIDLVLPIGTTRATYTIFARIVGGQKNTLSGVYTSAFGSGSMRINYGSFLLPPSCSAIKSPEAVAPFTVQATVDRSCDVDAEGLNFGNVATIDKDIDAEGKINVSCTPNLSYKVALNGGLSNAAQPTQRKMAKGTDSIVYGLYQNLARTTPWGSADNQVVAGTGNGEDQYIMVYGRVPKQTTPPVGTYTDTVVVTVTY